MKQKKQSLMDTLKQGYKQGYEQGYLRTLAVSVRCSAMTEEKAAEKCSLSIEEFREKVKQLHSEKE